MKLSDTCHISSIQVATGSPVFGLRLLKARLCKSQYFQEKSATG